MEKSREITEIKNQWLFEAVLKNGEETTVLSTLKAVEGGECDDIETTKGSWRCGLATSLLEFCFTDPDIGSLNLERGMLVLACSTYITLILAMKQIKNASEND